MLGAAALAVTAPLNGAVAQQPIVSTDDEIIVTGSPIARTEHESIIGGSVLSEEEIAKRNDISLGQLLRREPGISTSFFGPAASRPIVRGQGGPRVGVLDAGIGSIDASTVSDDHAVAVDPATTERIEIVRGPAALYYGSTAAGGVINVFDGRIPNAVPEGGVDGALRVGLGSVDESVETAGGFDAHLGTFGGADLVFHGDGFFRNTDDFEIPGFAESERLRALEEAEEEDHDDDDDHDHDEEEEEVFGIAENSDTESKGGSVGASLIFENGFIGVSGKILRANYGIPGGGHHHHEEEEEHGDDDHDEDEHEEEEEEEEIRIDLEQERLDLMGEFNSPFLIFETTRVRFGWADYVHTELEGAEIGTVFKNEGYEARIELVERQFGNFRGASGFQFSHRDFEAIGDEAFTPPNITDQFGVFTVREYETGPLLLQVAGRYEHTNTEAKTVGLERSFDTFSVSAGAGFEATENIFFGVNLYRTERAPAPEELFSDGPHLATNAYEIGDPDLDTEVALGVEVTAHGENDRFSATVNGFFTSYDNYIALIARGDELDELPVFEFLARDATFRGFEAEVAANLFTFGAFDIGARAQGDYVRAKFTNGGGDVPRIPPLRGIVGLEAASPHFDVSAELEMAAEQDNVATDELPTDGYQLFNLAATWRPGGADSGFSVQIRADNITDEEARLHSSFLKDMVPLPGRNVRLTVRGTF